MSIVLLLCLLIPISTGGRDDDEVRKAAAALDKGDLTTALKLTDQVLKSNPKHANAHVLHGQIKEMQGEFKAAIADQTRALELDPALSQAYNHRGSAYFKLGKFAQSIADFDAYLAKHPERVPHHWQRGISCYYAGRFDEGRRQFEGYETVDANDVENAVWQFLCVARKEGADKARAGLLKVQTDTRVPMMQVYGLFAGKAKPDEVLSAAKKAKTPEQLNMQLFYAYLYLALYYEATNEPAKALENMETAVSHRVPHYMWEVARVHRDLLRHDKNGPAAK